MLFKPFTISNNTEGFDEPDDIVKLIKRYPEFQAIYERAYQLCRNVEDIMGIFSEELRMLDRNTVQLMIDDMQKLIDSQKEQLSQKDAQLLQMTSKLEDALRRIAELENK